MTMKFMEEGHRFGRTWVDRIMGKVDKDQGVANAGKVLGIGDDGQVVPVEQSGGSGGSGLPYVETVSDVSTLFSKVKVGDIISLTALVPTANVTILSNATITETSGVKHFTGISVGSGSAGNKEIMLEVTYVNNSALNFAPVPVDVSYYNDEKSISGVACKCSGLNTTLATRMDSSGLQFKAERTSCIFSTDDTPVIPYIKHSEELRTDKLNSITNCSIIHNS